MMTPNIVRKDRNLRTAIFSTASGKYFSSLTSGLLRPGCWQPFEMIVLSHGSGRWPPFVGYDGTVAEGDYTPGPGRDLAVVGDDQQRQSFKVPLLEESHHFFTGLRIDCAGWARRREGGRGC